LTATQAPEHFYVLFN